MIRRPDPLERAIELALQPGRFVRDGECFSFVGPLEQVEAKIRTLVRSAPKRAVALYETFLAACHEKAEELDDSSATFAGFVGTLFVGWVKARQAAGADRDETAARLLAWMDDDPYGYLYHLAEDLAKALDKAGLAAFERLVRDRYDGKTAPAKADEFMRDPAYRRRRWGEVLRALLAKRRDVEGYEKLCKETGLTPEDCQVLARMLVATRQPKEALRWIRQGLRLQKTGKIRTGGYDLEKLERELLRKLGRGRDALALAWARFKKDPGMFAYEDLMQEVPKGERQAWREKAMAAAARGHLSFVVELFLETKEIDRLVERLHRATDKELDGLGHLYGEQAAEAVAKDHPDVAAKVYRVLGLRILQRKKSRYYDAALSHFENARRCYERAEMGEQWEDLVVLVHEQHHRKTGFMAGFEKVVAGGGPSAEPTFLQRARASWKK